MSKMLYDCKAFKQWRDAWEIGKIPIKKRLGAGQDFYQYPFPLTSALALYVFPAIR